ncbi:MAG: hypothetical protein IAE95_11565 [Chitinophagaceae bacterium]|nr:hypothetical protein [Chitinophagaceae bacterium]
MENMYNDIDDLFREELSEHTEVPPPRVWNALEQRLDKDKKRRVFPFRWYWFVGLLFFITVLAGYFALTDGSGVGNGGATTNVAGASVTAPVAPGLNSVPAAESSDRVSVNSDTKKVDVERNAAVKSDQKKVKSLRSKKAVKEEDRKEAKNMSVEDEKATANAPTVGTSMYSYDEFDEPETPRNIDVAHADVKQYACAARGGKHKIAVAELSEALNEETAKQEKVATVTNPGEEKESEESPERAVMQVEKKVGQRGSQLAKTHAVVSKKKIHESSSVGGGAQSVVLSAATAGKSSVAKVNVGAKEVAVAQTGKSVNASAVTNTQSSAPAANGAAMWVAGSAKVAGAMDEKLATGKLPAVATLPNAEKGRLSGTANGGKTTGDEVGSIVKIEKEKDEKSAWAAQSSKGKDVGSGMGVQSTDKSGVKQPTGAKQGAADKGVAAKGAAVGQKGEVATKEAISRSGAVADNNEGQLTCGKEASKVMVMNKGKVSSASIVAATIPVVKAKPAAEAKTSGKPQTGKAGTEDEAGATTQLAIAVQAAKSEPVKKTEETKQPEAIDSVATGKKEDSAADNKSKLTKWALGLKGGFEMALAGAGSSKIAVSPFLQYRLGKKLSIMVQPAIKGVRQQVRAVGTQGNYYESKSGTGSYKLVDSALLYLVMTGDTLWRRNYEYTEKYDSMVKTYKTGGTYIEFELPVLLRFDVTPKFGVYGGLNMVYSNKQGVREETKVWTDQVARGEVSTLLPVNAAATLPTTTGLNYTGTPLASYSGPTYPDDRSGLMRMGYMLGVSYEFKKRWLADAMLQQSFVSANVQGGTDLNKPFGMPYIRFTIGYRFGER